MIRKTCRVCGRKLPLDALVTDSHASLGMKAGDIDARVPRMLGGGSQ